MDGDEALEWCDPSTGEAMRKNFGAVVGSAGAILLLISLAWEYARVVPSYRFIVEPWSMRGFEMVHGWVAFALGVALLLSVLLVAPESATRRPRSLIVTGIIALLGIVTAGVFMRESYAIDLDGGVGIAISLLLAVALNTTAKTYLADRVPMLKSQLVSAGSVLVLAIILAFLIFPAIGELTLPAWVWLGITLLGIGGISSIVHPVALAPYRMLVNVSVFAALAHTLSAGAIRSTLLNEQSAVSDVSAQYKDLQVTSGWMIGVGGAVLVFIGAVSLWAKRRDQIKTRERAEKQREAARQSAAEIAASQKA